MPYPTSVVFSDLQHERLRRLKARRGDHATSDVIRQAVDAGLDVLERHQDQLDAQKQAHVKAVAATLVLGG